MRSGDPKSRLDATSRVLAAEPPRTGAVSPSERRAQSERPEAASGRRRRQRMTATPPASRRGWCAMNSAESMWAAAGRDSARRGRGRRGDRGRALVGRRAEQQRPRREGSEGRRDAGARREGRSDGPRGGALRRPRRGRPLRRRDGDGARAAGRQDARSTAWPREERELEIAQRARRRGDRRGLRRAHHARARRDAPRRGAARGPQAQRLRRHRRLGARARGGLRGARVRLARRSARPRRTRTTATASLLMQRLLNASAQHENERPAGRRRARQRHGRRRTQPRRRAPRAQAGKDTPNKDGSWAARGTAHAGERDACRASASCSAAADFGIIGMLRRRRRDPDAPTRPLGHGAQRRRRREQGRPPLRRHHGRRVRHRRLGPLRPGRGRRRPGRRASAWQRLRRPRSHGHLPRRHLRRHRRRHGKPGGGYAPKAPSRARATACRRRTGTCRAEVIQRIVRQNDGRYRFCYQHGLKRTRTSRAASP